MKSFNHKNDESVSVLADRLNTCLQVLKDENNTIDQSALALDVTSRISGSDTLKKVFGSFTPLNESGTKNAAADYLEAIEEIAKVSGKAIPNEWSRVLGSSNVIHAVSGLVKMIGRNVVLKVGRSIGYKFKPWGAVKLSARFAQAVPLLNLAGSVWEYESHRREKKQKEEAARKVRQFKSDVTGMLREASEKIGQAVHDELIGNVEKALLTSLQLVTEQKRNLASLAKGQQEICIELECKRSECLALYDDVYGRLTDQRSEDGGTSDGISERPAS